MVFLSHTHCWTPCDGPVPSRAGCGSSVAVEAVPWPRASVHPQELIQLMSTLKQAHFLTLSSWLQAQLDNLWILHVLGLKTETWRSFSSVTVFCCDRGSGCCLLYPWVCLYYLSTIFYAWVRGNKLPIRPSEEHLFTARKEGGWTQSNVMPSIHKEGNTFTYTHKLTCVSILEN